MDEVTRRAKRESRFPDRVEIVQAAQLQSGISMPIVMVALSVTLCSLTFPSFDLHEHGPFHELRDGNVEEVVLDAQSYGEMGRL
jgi:hypothetical protein